MLVAFLYDLIVRKESNGKVSVRDVYQKLFALRSLGSADGNDVIIKLLTSTRDTQGFSKSYIEGRNRLDLEMILPAYGLQLDSKGSTSRLNVSKTLTHDERKLVRSLGYRD